MSHHVALARQYEQDVLDGTVPVCRWVRLAVERNRRDMARKRGFPYVFDESKAAAVCVAVERFPHIKGEKAVKAGTWPDGSTRWATVTLEPWQCWLLTCVFGWVHRDTRMRRFRTALVLVPRKNGKSFLAAAVALYMLACDGESGPEVYSAATTRDQAAVVADTAMAMARREPMFRQHFGVVEYKTYLDVPETSGVLKALSADAHTLDGLNPHCAIVDEVHAHKTRAVWDVLDTAVGARAQPLLFPISTAGSSTVGICYELLTYLHKLLERRFTDETFFGVNYTIDAEDEARWWEQDVLRKANPNFGVSVFADDLLAKARKARHTPSAAAAFKVKRLNVWTNAESPWLSAADWDGCYEPGVRIEDCAGLPCRISVDLAQVRDIASVVIGFDRPDGKVAIFARHYLPEDTIESSPIAQMGAWVSTGHLTATSGNVIDFGRIEDDIIEWAETYGATEIIFDPALATFLMQRLQDRFPPRGGQDRVIVVLQHVKEMDPAMKETERLVLRRELVHDGDPVFAWMMSNVVIQRDHKDQIYPRKLGGKDSHHKIDGVVAWLLQAYRRLSFVEEQPSKYETGGVVTIQPTGGAHA